MPDSEIGMAGGVSVSGLHVNRSRERVVSTAPDDRETRWCFTCRKHVQHTWELWEEPFPSYYEPRPVIRCPLGHSAIDFPGTMDGPDLPSASVWAALIATRRSRFPGKAA